MIVYTSPLPPATEALRESDACCLFTPPRSLCTTILRAATTTSTIKRHCAVARFVFV